MTKPTLHKGPLHLVVARKDRESIRIDENNEIVLNETNSEDYSVNFTIKEYDDELTVLTERLNKVRRDINEAKKNGGKDISIYEKEKKKIEAEQVALKESFSDIRILSITVNNGLNGIINKHICQKIYQSASYTLSPFLRGGGKMYLEAFHEEEDPMLKPPFGVYVAGMGKPTILRYEWSDCDFKPIEGAVKFGSTVLLHIYTKDLYGQELEVELWDRDIFSRNDQLETTDPNEESANQASAGKMYLVRTCEVDVHKRVDELESEKSKTEGHLFNQTSEIGYAHVQKAILQVTTTATWIPKAGDDLKVFPVVRGASVTLHKNKPDSNFLTVNNNGKMCVPPSNRSAALIGQVTTNVAYFHPCGYQTITISDEREAILFDQSKPMSINTFEVIAGSKPKTITVKLDDHASTSDCGGKGLINGIEHSGNVFDITNFPEQQANAASVQKEEELKWKLEGKSKTGVGSVSSENKITSLAYERCPVNVKKTDTKMTFDVNYVYNNIPMTILNIAGLPAILRYFWVGNSFKTDDYRFSVLSCRHMKHDITVKVYPDVKWTLQAVFKNKTTEIEVQSNLKEKYRKKLDTKKIASIGDRELELALLAESDGNSTNVTREMGKTIEEVLKPLKQIVDFVNNTILGKKNKEGDYAEPTPEHQAAAEEARQRAEAQQRAKTQREIDKENKAEEERVKELKKRKQHLESLRKQSRDPSKTPEQREKANREMQSETARASKKNPSLMRKTVGIDIQWPEISFGFSWNRVPINSPKFKDLAYSSATLLEGFIKADPLIKADIFLDFLALAQRAHPLVLAIIAGLDIGLSMFGDGSKIVAELRLELEITGELEGEINMKTKEDSFSKQDSEFAKIGGSAALSVVIGIYLKMETRATYIWVGKTKVKIELEAEIKAEAKVSATSTIGCDDTGFYFAPQWQFEGLYIQGTARAKGKAGSGKVSIETSVSAEVKYQAIDPQDPVEYGKLYFRNPS